MKYFFRVTYLREGKERSVTPCFRDPADAAPWAEKVYGTNLLTVEPVSGKAVGMQQALELVLESPSTEPARVNVPRDTTEEMR